MSTLSTLTAHPPVYTFDPSLASAGSSPSLISTLIPSLQGQGPIGSAYRIAVKLHQYTLKRLGGGIVKESFGSTSRRREEELKRKALKVVDLLEHSADLGNSDALYTLAEISLVSSRFWTYYFSILNFRFSSPQQDILNQTHMHHLKGSSTTLPVPGTVHPSSMSAFFMPQDTTTSFQSTNRKLSCITRLVPTAVTSKRRWPSVIVTGVELPRKIIVIEHPLGIILRQSKVCS
jgi:hypothetical protein